MAILCSYINTWNPDVTMQADIIAVYCGMSLDRILKKIYAAFGSLQLVDVLEIYQLYSRRVQIQ